MPRFADMGIVQRRGVASVVAAVTLVGAWVLWPLPLDPFSAPGTRSLWRLMWVLQPISFVGCGLYHWLRRPERSTGPLLALTGLLLLNDLLRETDSAVLFTWVSSFTQGLWIVPLVYLVLAYPGERLRTRPARATVVLLAAERFLDSVVGGLFYEPAADPYRAPGFPEGMNLWAFWPNNDILFRGVRPVTLAMLIAGYGLLLALVLTRWRRASGPERWAFGPMAAPVLVYVVIRLTFLLFAELPTYISMFWEVPVTLPLPLAVTLFAGQFIALSLVPVLYLVGLGRVRARRARATDLAVDLELASQDPQAALRRALGDPSLELGYALEDGSRYVTADGGPLDLSLDDPSRALTPLRRDGHTLAVVVHDAALREQQELLHGALSVARLALDNERLAAIVRAQLREVEASRHRLVTAQDDARRRIERDLHDGAQQRLLRLSMALQVAKDSLPTGVGATLGTSLRVAEEELDAALHDLRDLAHGIYPAVLTQRGIGAAIRSLAERSVVPVIVQDLPDGRFRPDVETTAFFFVSEALTNTAKHASASRAAVSARVAEDALEVMVEDDGVGGAGSRAGSGLRGIEDRLHTVGGRLTVTSPVDGGTRLVARLPVQPAEEGASHAPDAAAGAAP